MKVSFVVAMLAILPLAGCDWTKPKMPNAEERSAKARQANAQRLKRACGSAETYDRLKALAFDEAAKVRRGESPLLDKIAANSLVRMERPVAKSRDETLNVTVCTGRMVLELPPGAEDAFDGDRRLEADVEYAAQEAVDGSGLVYQMQGADPIIYRLAALSLPARAGQAPAPEIELAQAETTELEPEAEPAPPPPRAAPPMPERRERPAPPPEPPREPARPRLTLPELEPDREPAPSERAPREAVRTASSPSFNCRYGRSRVERMICSSDRLARQDRAMSSAFYAALAGGDPSTRAELRSSRDRFLRFRERCRDEACVSQAYADRVAEIRDIAGQEY